MREGQIIKEESIQLAKQIAQELTRKGVDVRIGLIAFLEIICSQIVLAEDHEDFMETIILYIRKNVKEMKEYMEKNE